MFLGRFSTGDSTLKQDTKYKEFNLEYELLSTNWILEKVRSCDAYAQNLYAALCNNTFRKNEVISILKETCWSCSWRHAGGIIADMRQYGNYLDWYCSGSGAWPSGHVEEGVVVDKIKTDLFALGWIVL